MAHVAPELTNFFGDQTDSGDGRVKEVEGDEEDEEKREEEDGLVRLATVSDFFVIGGIVRRSGRIQMFDEDFRKRQKLQKCCDVFW